MRSGQAMIETVIAVLVITSIFLVLYRLSYLFLGKISLEHAAMRVARARVVGFNDFMCVKTARVSTIPVAGKRLWPEIEPYDYSRELANVAIYMQSKDAAIARGVLEYEGWERLRVEPGDASETRVSMGFTPFGERYAEENSELFHLEGSAGIQNNYSFFMEDQGL